MSNISFPDFDLDETDLGGTLTWTPPEDESQIEHYVPWLVDSHHVKKTTKNMAIAAEISNIQ